MELEMMREPGELWQAGLVLPQWVPLVVGLAWPEHNGDDFGDDDDRDDDEDTDVGAHYDDERETWYIFWYDDFNDSDEGVSDGDDDDDDDDGGGHLRQSCGQGVLAGLGQSRNQKLPGCNHRQ